MMSAAALLLQLLLAVALGEALGYWLFRTSLLRARLPEVAVLVGVPGWAVFGYVALAMSLSARAVLPAVLVTALGLYLYRPGTMPELPGVLAAYRQRRGASRLLQLALAMVAIGVLVLAVLVPASATAVSVAVYDFPLRDPQSPKRYLIGPLGCDVLPGAILAWLPYVASSSALPSVLLGPLAWLQAGVWIASGYPLAAALAVTAAAASRTDISLLGIVALLVYAAVRRSRTIAAIATLGLATIAIIHVSVLRGEAEQNPDLAWLRRSFASAFAREQRPSAEAQAAQSWIAGHLPLTARVAAFDPRSGTWHASLDRPGNTVTAEPTPAPPGYLPINRAEPPLPPTMLTGIWANDYILLPAGRESIDSGIAKCGAPETWRGTTLVLREVTNECRHRLFTAEVGHAIDMADRRARLPEALRLAGDPAKLPADLLAVVVIDKPIHMFQLRAAVEKLWYAGRLEEARHALEPVLRERPELPEAQYSMGYTLHVSGKPAQAIPHYSQALQLKYDEFWVRFNRGTALALVGKQDQARLDLRRAVELNPTHEASKELLAKLGAR
ncbi:MAG: tetratricopeptide repeat protein [Bryobacterales bacterium]|nr:tetratricopeptide repeat protein [Bryobacterales bacterium]